MSIFIKELYQDEFNTITVEIAIPFVKWKPLVRVIDKQTGETSRVDIEYDTVELIEAPNKLQYVVNIKNVNDNTTLQTQTRLAFYTENKEKGNLTTKFFTFSSEED